MEDKKLNRVAVIIHGEEYTVTGEENAEYIQMLAAYVDRRMSLIQKRNPSLSTSRVAVLAVLNIADELNKLQDDYDDILKALDEEKKKHQA